MACSPTVQSGGPITIWSDRANTVNHPITGPLESVRHSRMRGLMDFSARTGSALTLRVVARYSEDGLNWDAWFEPLNRMECTGTGITNRHDIWMDLAKDNSSANKTVKRYIQLGIAAFATGATINELGTVAWRFEVLGVS